MVAIALGQGQKSAIKGLDEAGGSGSHLRLSRLVGVCRRGFADFNFGLSARRLPVPFVGVRRILRNFLWQQETTTW